MKHKTANTRQNEETKNKELEREESESENKDTVIDEDNGVQTSEVTKEIESLKNQLARALADYQNQNKRFAEERSQIFVYAAQNVLEHLIPVLDILEKAQSHLKDQGLGMAISEFKRVLQEEGLEEIRPERDNPFDHETMEAVESVEEEGGKTGFVAECTLSGWKFKDGKVIRYAKVKVFTGK